MIKPEKLLRDDPQVLRDLVFTESERPLGVQVAVRDVELLVPAVQRLEALGFDFVDLNLGCPLKKECNKGWGAALLRDRDRAARLIEATVNALSCPVTVKVRTGYELHERQAIDVVTAAVDAGASLICVHGRTKMGWYRESIDLQAIRDICEAVGGRVPVVGNGDVVSLESALTMFRETGCDAVMIGRGAVGNPWLFERINAFLDAGTILPEPVLATVRALYSEHMDALQAEYGDRKGFSQVKRYAYYYFGRFGQGNAWRAKVANTRRRHELEAVLDQTEWAP
jgi:tRNA-dihydrouridine synthase B